MYFTFPQAHRLCLLYADGLYVCTPAQGTAIPAAMVCIA